MIRPTQNLKLLMNQKIVCSEFVIIVLTMPFDKNENVHK